MLSSPGPGPCRRKRGGRAWHREYFADHVRYESGDPCAMVCAGQRNARVKVWCKRCLEARVEDVVRVETQQYERGELAAVRERHLIVAELWNATDAGWIPCDTSRCLVHLRDCELQPPNVRERARSQKEEQNQARRVPDNASPPDVPSLPEANGVATERTASMSVPLALPPVALPVVVHPVVLVYPTDYFSALRMQTTPVQLAPQWLLPLSQPVAPSQVPPAPAPGWSPVANGAPDEMNLRQGGSSGREVEMEDPVVSWGAEPSRNDLADPQTWEDLERLCKSVFEDP